MRARAQKVTMGNYVFELAMVRAGAAPPPRLRQPEAEGRCGSASSGWGGALAVVVAGGQAAARGYASSYRRARRFLVAGANLGIKFSSTSRQPHGQLAGGGRQIRERRVGGGRHLAGDDTGMGGGDGQPAPDRNPGILRVSLFSYR